MFTTYRKYFAALALCLCLALTSQAEDSLTLHTRNRVETSQWQAPESHTKTPVPKNNRPFTLEYKTQHLDPSKTAIIICDMWDTMCCKIPADRVAEMAPHMNEVVTAARASGVLIVHAPSGSMDYYKDSPGRALCMNAPELETDVPLKWNYLNEDIEPPLPIDDSDNGWEGPVSEGRPQTHQHDAIKISDSDAIGDSKDIYYLLRQQGIENVILMGVHTNMCVLGRPFGIRQLTYLGFNVLLMRDMTDSLYNPAMEPKVSHYRGTEMVIEHIEKYWCPTIASTDFTHKPAFRFAGDPRPHVVFMVSDDHYHADKTVPRFAQYLREEHDLHCTILHGESEHNLPGIENLQTADAAVLYVRRLGLPTAQVDALKQYVASGKPIIGLRTANHALSLKFKPPKDFTLPAGVAEWREFDADILGGNYNNHGPNEAGTEVANVTAHADHPLLNGVTPSTWHSTGSLYFLAPIADDATLLMQGSIPDRTEPLTWFRSPSKTHGKVFFTGLGHPDDFQVPAFRQLLVNAINWSLE